MTEHYSSATKQVFAFCNVCNKKTMSNVAGHRLGSCTEHAPDGASANQRKAREKREISDQQPGLELK